MSKSRKERAAPKGLKDLGAVATTELEMTAPSAVIASSDQPLAQVACANQDIQVPSEIGPPVISIETIETDFAANFLFEATSPELDALLAEAAVAPPEPEPEPEYPQDSEYDQDYQSANRFERVQQEQAPEVAEIEPIVEIPVEQGVAEETSTDPKVAAALALFDQLQKLTALKAPSAAKRVASGSRARPNVTYTLLEKPPSWASTPQVAQLQQILFEPAFVEAHRQADGSVKVSEPDLFAQVESGVKAGVLRTKQPGVRIFSYYKTTLLNSNCLRWQ